MPRYVFDTRQVVRYRFPTHTNDLVMDRADAAASEAFLVVVQPGEVVPRHVHEDAEQVFYVIAGEGALSIGVGPGESHPMRVGDFVRTPPGTYHSVSCEGPVPLTYLSIDCFTAGPPPAEPTWESHVREMCRVNGWDFDAVRLGQVDSATPVPPATIDPAH